jgi:glycosyltransferase involved in cell wall biosynthesis
VATVPLAWRGRHGVAADPLAARADLLVTLSPRARDMYADAGIPRERLRVVPNFVSLQRRATIAGPDSERWLCVARLTPEKGVLDLVRSWPAGRTLDIVGEGEQREAIEAAAPPGVRLLGSIDNGILRESMPGYTGLVVPSRWFEGLPTVYLEALAAGLPVVATSGNSAADDVVEHGLGRAVAADPADGELAAALDDVIAGGETMRGRVRVSFAERYTPETWVRAVGDVYHPTAAPVAS